MLYQLGAFQIVALAVILSSSKDGAGKTPRFDKLSMTAPFLVKQTATKFATHPYQFAKLSYDRKTGKFTDFVQNEFTEASGK